MAPLKEFDSTSITPVTLNPDPYNVGYPPLPATLTHYSAILVAVALLMRVSNDNEEEKVINVERSIQYYALRLINRFLLIFRRGVTVSQDYRSVQLQRMQRDLFVHTLILLSHYDWDIWKLSITVLNLCDAFDPSHTDVLEQAVLLFEKELKEDYLSLNSSTVSYIRGLLSGFKFNGEMCEVSRLDSAPEKFIYYKKKVGYLICDSVKRSYGSPYSFGHIISPALKESQQDNVFIPNSLRLFQPDSISGSY